MAIGPLPEYKHKEKIIQADMLLEKIKLADSSNCLDPDKEAMLTIIDYRTANFIKTDSPVHAIKTDCETIKCLLDDFSNPEVRSQIPKKGLVVLDSETGNRGWAAKRYLFQYGFTNIVSLKFGMRAWIKAGYPLDIQK